MYAVIETGGKQYKVAPGDVIYVEKLDKNPDETFAFERVLAIGGEENLKCGRPYIDGAKVNGKVIKNGKQKKIVVFKMKPKKNYRRKQGHRQHYTKVQIIDIVE